MPACWGQLIFVQNLFGNAAIGEYFRVFMCYGVIAVALVMHAWSGVSKKKKLK